QRHERTVQRHSGLSRNVKLDAADSAPNKLRPVTGETNGVVTEDAVTEVSGTPNDAARSHNRSGVLKRGINEQGTVNAVLLAEERRLNNPVEREPVKLLAVLSENVQRINNTVIGRRGEGNTLRGVRNGSLERSVTMQGGRVESLSERLRNLVLKELHVVAGVSTHNFSRHDGNRGDLVRGEPLNTNAGFRGRLLAAFRNPARSSLTSRNNDFLPRSTKRHLAGKLHHRRHVPGILDIVLSLGGLNEPAKVASGSCGSLCHNYSCVSPRIGGLVNAKRATQSVLKLRAIQRGLASVKVVNNNPTADLRGSRS